MRIIELIYCFPFNDYAFGIFANHSIFLAHIQSIKLKGQLFFIKMERTIQINQMIVPVSPRYELALEKHESFLKQFGECLFESGPHKEADHENGHSDSNANDDLLLSLLSLARHTLPLPLLCLPARHAQFVDVREYLVLAECCL
jgi:hypothetical protein